MNKNIPIVVGRRGQPPRHMMVPSRRKEKVLSLQKKISESKAASLDGLQLNGRVIVYTGQVPYVLDILRSNLYKMTEVGSLAATVLGMGGGYPTRVSGFPCVPISPPGLEVLVGSLETPDIIYSHQPLDETDYGVLPANTNPQDRLYKQGFNYGQVALSTPAPTVPGNSVIHLVQVAFQTVDANDVSRPYYNDDDPSQPIFQNNYDTRTDIAVIEIKHGIEAASPTPPTPDAGFIGLWHITVAYGQTSIVSGNIAKVSTVEGQPFITESLTQKISKSQADNFYLTIPSFQNIAPLIAANDTGSVNAIEVNTTPEYQTLTSARVYVVVANTNNGACTLKLGSFPAYPIRINTPSGLSPLNGGEMCAGGTYEFYYEAGLGVWVLLNPNPAALRMSAQYSRAVFTLAATQIVGISSTAKVAFDGGIIGTSSWWNGTDFWFLPPIPGKYTVSAVVNSIGTDALQALTLIKNSIIEYTSVGVPKSVGEPMQLSIPAITVTANGTTDIFYLDWKNTSAVLSTTLGTDGVSGFGASLTNFFEIKYEGE